MKLYTSLLACLSWLPALPQQIFEKLNLPPLTSNYDGTPSAAWEDYDNDGDLDVFVCLGETDGIMGNSFYINNGDGTFTATSCLNILTPGKHTLGASWGDFNNDGYPDLFVTHGNVASYQSNNLFKNNKNGTFTPMLDGHIVNHPGWFVAATWADFNKDGFLDLLVSNNENVNGTNDKNYLYINNHDDTFTWKTDATFGNLIGRWMTNLVADYDNDGWPDVALINRDGKSYLFKNDQHGNFIDATTASGFQESFNSRGGCWGDYNNDGYMDLFIANNGNKSLYTNNKNGTFTKVVVGELVFESYKSNGSSWGDLDNDGDLDLVISNEDEFTPNSIYYNDGNGKLTRHYTSVASLAGFSYANNLVDYDNDGNLDIFILNRYQENYLFRNTGNCNNWLKVKLDGGVKNNLGVGVKVKLKTSATASWQTREINTQSGGGYSAQNGTSAHFGVGAASVIDSLLVLWPEGDTTKLSALTSNQFIIISREKAPVVIHSSSASSPLQIASNDSACEGPVMLQAIGGRFGYTWSLKEDETTVIGTESTLPWSIATNTTFVLHDGCGVRTEKVIELLDGCHADCSLIAEDLSIEKNKNLITEGETVDLEVRNANGIVNWYLLPEQEPFATGPRLSLTLTAPLDVVAIDQCGRADTVRLQTLFIPNVITPNNDSFNETFKIKGVDESVHITITNRWGNTVYERASYDNSWNGEGLPTGIYYYYLTIGKPGRLKYRGSVSILR